MAEWKTTTVPLEYPFTVGTTSYTAIVLREPDADAVEQIEDAGFQVGVQPTQRQLRASVVALSKLPNEIIGKLHRNDFMKVVEATVPLLQGSLGLEPPATSSETTSMPSVPIAPTG